jgi:hypothetical protein
LGWLLAEAQAGEAGDPNLRTEQGQSGHQRVGALGSAQLVGGRRLHLTGLRAQSRVDALRRRPVEHVGMSDRQAVVWVGAAVEPAQPPGELAHRGELAAQVLAASGGEERLRLLLRHLAAVLDASRRHRHVANGRQ